MSAKSLLAKSSESSRKPQKAFGKNVSNSFGILDLGANRVNGKQFHQLDELFHTHPAVQSARTVLHAQLFSGGLQLVRNGEVLKVLENDTETNSTGVKAAFNRHLQSKWLEFAKDVADCFLKWGICAVVFDLDSEEDQIATAARLAKEEEGIAQPAKRAKVDTSALKRLVPSVPVIGSYDVGWEHIGRYQYSRRYLIYSQTPGAPIAPDEQATVFVRNAPDSAGNLNSPLATVANNARFVESLAEMAMIAEISRSQPQIVTQLRKEEKGNGLDAGALFFDSESRNLQAGQETEESTSAAHALEMQAQLCSVINRYQNQGEHRSSYNTSGGVGSSNVPTYQAPEVPPRLFCLPKAHELAPNVNKPESRGDLEALYRLNIDLVCSAMGCPSSLLFEGRFSGKSSQQLQLLNSTISQLGRSIDDVLTRTYLALYPDESIDAGGARVEAPTSGGLELKLRIAPLSAAEEIVGFFGAGIVDVPVAVPAALHSLGCSASEVDAALKRIQSEKDKKDKIESDDLKMQKEERKVALEAAKKAAAAPVVASAAPAKPAAPAAAASKPSKPSKPSSPSSSS